MKCITIGFALGLAAMLGGCGEKLPIMKCDPVTLTRGMTMAEVIAACGEPNDSSEKDTDWYPLRGDTRGDKYSHKEIMLIYGSVSDDKHNVNLYVQNGRLDSVQIFGDYK